ncbi:peptidylprolyl isomerase [Tropicibacter sp. R15_0]|uniref:FKBP-type peptidyl-prolyl cis-trans isomerase n=1 Tax=Tropicibacter sp. R15_0 TaxID=2821101 RepID=UPI001ADC949D|nr:peptidylprolyl isomerase [Tropicibacter sp. R15_0]MBO9465503.1 peptidylprolyl isomerase [Tropicibacter sp. R15_0]
MTQAKSGDTVRIHYTGTLDDGSTFDSSAGRDPLEFKLGSGQVIPGFDKGVDGMTVGEKKTIHIPADEAYGQKDDRAVQAIPRENIPDDIPLEVGIQLQMQSPTGQVMPVTVTEVTDTEVTLDANHPLAGKDLTFELELVSVGCGDESCGCGS